MRVINVLTNFFQGTLKRYYIKVPYIRKEKHFNLQSVKHITSLPFFQIL